jgi:hypothetical protein
MNEIRNSRHRDFSSAVLWRQTGMHCCNQRSQACKKMALPLQMKSSQLRHVQPCTPRSNYCIKYVQSPSHIQSSRSRLHYLHRYHHMRMHAAIWQQRTHVSNAQSPLSRRGTKTYVHYRINRTCLVLDKLLALQDGRPIHAFVHTLCAIQPEAIC